MASPLEAPRVHRFTREEYARMGEAGLFQDERVELLDGEVIAMSPQKPPHASTVQVMAQRLARLIGDRFCIRCQLPLALDQWSEPEPDIAVCESTPDNYSREHPQPAQVRLVVEVADTSLSFDRGRKSAAYARVGIPELWIVDVVGRRIEVRVAPEPASGTYARTTSFEVGAEIESLAGFRLRVDDILPPA